MKTSYTFFISLLLLVIIAVSGSAQNYEEEIGFTFVKAKYLFDTDRYDDAIRELNRVINQDPTLEDALLYRARAKYNLAAYLGTKKDVLTYIELKGITPESVTMLAKAEYQLSEFDAALNTLSTALLLIKDDVDLYEFRASIFMDRDQRLQACQDWEAASRLGSARALMAAKRNCGYTPEEEVVNKKPQEMKSTINPPITNSTENDIPTQSQELPSGISSETPSDIDTLGSTSSAVKPAAVSEDQGIITETGKQTEMESSGNESAEIIGIQTEELDSVVIEPEPELDPRLLDNSENEIIIDEDLTLVITGQGLGSRELLRKPNILILSDEEGEVVIDICVSRGGRIVSTQYNETASTLQRKSLVSLALRKSKDFWFEKSDLIEQCGRIVFKVKGV